MSFDSRVLFGVLIGMVLGLHFHASLVAYLPIMLVAAVALILRGISH